MIDIKVRRRARVDDSVVSRIPVAFDDDAPIEQVHLREPDDLRRKDILTRITTGAIGVNPMLEEPPVIPIATTLRGNEQRCERLIDGGTRHAG